MPSRTSPALLTRLRRELLAAADPDRAAQMQAYMKSAMPFHGVPATAMRATCKRVFADLDISSAETWRDLTLALWRNATHREERYAAIELTGDRRARAHQTLATMPMYEELIVTGAWWDYVDVIAAHRIGGLLKLEPAAMKKTLRAWSRDADMWKRRTAIISQIRLGAGTDLELLYACIEPSLDSREFFLRKAIGWSLREFAKSNMDEVIRYVRERRDVLSPLSKREALKAALASGLVKEIP